MRPLFRSRKYIWACVVRTGLFALILPVLVSFYSVTAKSGNVSDPGSHNIIAMIKEVDSYRGANEKKDWVLDVTDIVKKHLGKLKSREDAVLSLGNSGFSIFYSKNSDDFTARLSRKTISGLWVFGDVFEIYFESKGSEISVKRARVVYEHL